MRLVKRNTENLIAIVASIFTSVIFLFKSPLHPWIGGKASTDSSVFKTVALMMKMGYMPYRDSFDHKGPLIYIINYIGNSISYYRGLWIIEVIFLAATVYSVYKISRLKCNILASGIVSLLSFSLMFEYFRAGNFTEEYAMPFIAVAIYVFADYILNSKISNFRIILSGFGLGAVFMLRANMIAVWIIFCIYIFVGKLLAKEYKELGKYVIFFVVGFGIITLPIMLWLLINKDISYFFHDYFYFNMLYSSAEGGRALFAAKWSAFITFVNTSVYIAAFAALLFHVKKDDDKNRFNLTYLFYMIINIMLLVMSGMKYWHYGMIIVPAMSYPLSLIFADIEEINHEKVKKGLLMLVIVYVMISFLPPWFELIDKIPSDYETKDVLKADDDIVLSKVIDLIQENTKKKDSISVYGNWDLIYVLSKRKHATRYSYQDPIGVVMPQIMEEYWEQLREELPRMVVIQAEHYDDDIGAFLMDNSYELLWTEDEKDLKSVMVYLYKGK